MPTDPPGRPENGSSFDEVVIYQSSSGLIGCIGFCPPSGSPSIPGEEYQFRFAPQPGITVSQQRGARWQRLSTVLLNKQEVGRFLRLIQPVARNTTSPQYYSELQVELRKQGAAIKTYSLRVPYGISADADERDLTYLGIYSGSTISLGRVYQLASEAKEQGVPQVRYTSKPRRQTAAYRERRLTENSAWENKRALNALIQMPGYSEVMKRFTIDVARLQEDKYGVALVASLTPRRTGMLDTVEWHCPLRGSDGRQFLTTLEPVARQAEASRWLHRWKTGKQDREVVARIRVAMSELVLIESGHELPVRQLKS